VSLASGDQSSSFYRGGCWSQGSHSFSSVTYRRTNHDSYSYSDGFTQEESGESESSWSHTGTGTNISDSGGGGGGEEGFGGEGMDGPGQTYTVDVGSYSDSGSRSQSFTSTYSFTYTQAGLTTASLYEAGTFSGGRYSLSSVLWDSQARNNATYTQAGTLTNSGSASESHSGDNIFTGGGTINGSYSFSSSSTFIFNSGSNSGNSGTLHQEGSFSNGSYAYTSMTSSETASVNQSYQYSGSESQSGTSFTSNASYSGAGTFTSLSTLNKQGTFLNGSWSLSSILNDYTEQASESYTRTGQGTYVSGGTYNPVTSTYSYTYTTQGQSSAVLHEASSYANGSYSYASFSANESATSESHFQETGSNASLSSYSRDDTALHCYSMAQTGSGQAANYTQTVWDHYAFTYSSTPRSGSPFSSSGSTTLSSSLSGTFSLAAGRFYQPYRVTLVKEVGPSWGAMGSWRIEGSGGQGKVLYWGSGYGSGGGQYLGSGGGSGGLVLEKSYGGGSGQYSQGENGPVMNYSGPLMNSRQGGNPGEPGGSEGQGNQSGEGAEILKLSGQSGSNSGTPSQGPIVLKAGGPGGGNNEGQPNGNNQKKDPRKLPTVQAVGVTDLGETGAVGPAPYVPPQGDMNPFKHTGDLWVEDLFFKYGVPGLINLATGITTSSTFSQNNSGAFDVGDWKLLERGLGLLKAIGGGIEISVGVGLILAPEPTCITKIVGVPIALHGLDVTFTGLQEVWTGKPHQTFTEQGIQWLAIKLGANPDTAKSIAFWSDLSISLLGTFGGSFLLRGISAAGTRLVHLTSVKGEASVRATGILRGTQGIFAVEETVAQESTLLKVLRTFLSPKNTKGNVNIPEILNPYFTRPTQIGPLTLLQRLGGVFRGPPGSINLLTGEYAFSQMTIGQQIASRLFPQGGDFVFWIGYLIDRYVTENLYFEP
jgi:hypothetical protein